MSDSANRANDERDEPAARAGNREASVDENKGATPSAKTVIAGLSPQDLRNLVPQEILLKAASDDVEITAVSRQFSGPLPPAQMLEDYEKRIPGCGKMIVDNFEKNGNHRRDRERRGQHYAMLSLFLILAAILGCAYAGQSLIGSAVAVTGLGGLFLVSRVFGVSRLN